MEVWVCRLTADTLALIVRSFRKEGATRKRGMSECHGVRDAVIVPPPGSTPAWDDSRMEPVDAGGILSIVVAYQSCS